MDAVAAPDPLEGVREFADRLERLADELEKMMPVLRQLRTAADNMHRATARHVEGWEGSAEAFAAAAAQGAGFDRIEAARRRIVAIMREPFDDVA
jgi:hypothetical protein